MVVPKVVAQYPFFRRDPATANLNPKIPLLKIVLPDYVSIKPMVVDATPLPNEVKLHSPGKNLISIFSVGCGILIIKWLIDIQPHASSRISGAGNMMPGTDFTVVNQTKYILTCRLRRTHCETYLLVEVCHHRKLQATGRQCNHYPHMAPFRLLNKTQ
jgi:hypothetical protein